MKTPEQIMNEILDQLAELFEEQNEIRKIINK